MSFVLENCWFLLHLMLLSAANKVVFLLQLKLWFTLCGATSHFGQRLSTLLQILLNKAFIRGQYPVLSCANWIRAIYGSVCSIFGGGVPSCLLCSTEYGLCVGGYF